MLAAAQLKVSLRPLWSPAAAALGSLSQRFGDVVWNLVFSELQECGEGGGLSAVVAQQQSQADDEGNDDDIWEEERSWRDPSAHKLRVALVRWLDPEYRVNELIKVCRQKSSLTRFIVDEHGKGFAHGRSL